VKPVLIFVYLCFGNTHCSQICRTNCWQELLATMYETISQSGGRGVAVGVAIYLLGFLHSLGRQDVVF